MMQSARTPSAMSWRITSRQSPCMTPLTMLICHSNKKPALTATGTAAPALARRMQQGRAGRNARMGIGSRGHLTPLALYELPHSLAR